MPTGRTDPFAIVSLVASLAGIFFCFVGQIVGIVFGHLARSRIERSGDRGGGLPLAGLIVGYVELALLAVAIAFVAVNASHSVRYGDPPDAAFSLRVNLLFTAQHQATSPRHADVVQLAIRQTDFGGTVFIGSTNTHADDATDAQLTAAGWRLEVIDRHKRNACIYVPDNARVSPRVEIGPCLPGSSIRTRDVTRAAAPSASGTATRR
jgi:hypothetical protein